MLNPFTIPGRSGADGRPLCPWDTSEHEHYYAPVDHAPQAYSHFTSYLQGNGDFTKAGKVVLITGPEGSGKTSLMHRCAWSAQQHFTSRPNPPLAGIIDLTTDGLVGLDIAARARHICSRLNDELRFQHALDDTGYDELEKRAEDPPKFYPYLSRLLKDRGTAVIILMPPSEVAEEIYAYNGYAQGMFVFFCESSYATVSEIETKPVGLKPILHLEVDVLDETDGWAFVQHRLARASSIGTPYPSITESAIREFMKTRIRGRGKTTIRELQMTCENVFDMAVTSSSGQVTYSDFTQYYTEKGSLS
ncbi:ATP-binding protein [Streptomyces longwoodensis]|uniref:ATP-binding protein n=1 Tax=Streptomyces longwoodensis TaxID=68231 RepID=UPI0032498A48